MTATQTEKQNRNLTYSEVATICGNNEDRISRLAVELGVAERHDGVQLGWFPCATAIAREFKGVENASHKLQQIVASLS